MSIYRGKNKKEIYLTSLLYDAIEDSDLRSVKILLAEKKADPNLIHPKTRISPFHLVIGNESADFALEVATIILQHGGNPNIKSDDGLTPIHIAAAWGRYDILKLLLDCGGNPEIRDINKKTALHYAAEEKFLDCYNLLKLYVTDKANIMFREEDCTKYELRLDKILVNNGTTISEYEIVNEYKTDSICKDLPKLQDLPQSDTKEYVMNWCNNHLGTPITPMKILNSNGSTTCDDSDDSFKESDEERHSCTTNMNNIYFRKVYRKKVNKSKNKSSLINSTINSTQFSQNKEYSRESGLVTLQETGKIQTSSDYVTCTSGSSPEILECNIFDFDSLITNDETKSVLSTQTKSEGISSSGLSFINLSEVYKYEDKEEGIVLFERRFLKNPVSDGSGSVRSFNSSLPETIDYEDFDVDTIKRELTQLGYNPGPITITTKRVYLKKLKQLKKYPALCQNVESATRVYSNALEKTLKSTNWSKDISSYKLLDEAVLRQFSTPDPSKKWREGINKSSFTYLLLDPRITNNLPSRADSLSPKEIWENFLSAIFYVGKGKRSRPYDHLYDAVHLWNQGQKTSDNKKLDRIMNIWEDNCGVVCLHLFQNTIPVEAYTREAAIIEALKIENLCNAKNGNFYGVAATWTQKEKTMLGVFLLYKAMMIFLNEGERQLCPTDID